MEEPSQIGHDDVDWEGEWAKLYQSLDFSEFKGTSAIEQYDDFKFSLNKPTLTCPHHSRVKRMAIIEALAEPTDSEIFKKAAAFLAQCDTCRYICQTINEGFIHAIMNRQRIDDNH